MKHLDSLNPPDQSIHLGRKRIRALRVMILSLCLAVFALGAALPSGLTSAAVQRTRKISAPTRPAPRKASPKAAAAQPKPAPQKVQGPDEFVPGVPSAGEMGIARTTAEIMQSQAQAPPSKRPQMVPEREVPGRKERPQDPNAKSVASTPDPDAALSGAVKSDSVPSPLAPQTIALNFDTVTGPTETGAFPPDTMGSVGPSQFFVFLNGRLRTFTKATGAADGVINADPDVFFTTVLTPTPPPGINFTSDPQVRYDRLSARWILIIIDVPSTSAASIGDRTNRILIAVSDAASAGVISGATVWTFFFVQQDTVGGIPSTNEFLDYPSLGVDKDALYIGGDMFGLAGGFNTTAFVIRKTSVLGAGPVVTTAFRNLIGADGPLEPRGVDNYNPASTEGFFIGASFAVFGRLNMRRISTPGATPAISGDIPITVAATTFPISVDHLGDTGGTAGNVDGLDDRLYAAHIRNGRLWTAHSFTVNAAGVASTAAARRNAVRWYELIVPATVGTPTVNQSGTVFDTAATQAAARQFFIPSVMVSGQGHAALGYSTAGTPFRIDAATNGRLVGDTLGTLGAVAIYTTSSTAYNPPSDPGGPRRWGDYSFVSLDPLDDMTMWTVQEYCNATNTYGTRVAKLLAPPPPPTNTANPAAIQLNNPSTNVVVTGLAPAGQGFYDPGANLAAPALAFTHISASGAGIIVNSTTFNTPTQVTLNVSTVGSTPGAKTVTITNPDGQTTTVQILVGPTAARISDIAANSFDDGRVLLQWKSAYEIDNLGYNVYREVNGERTKINSQIIAGSALVTGPNVALTAGKSYAWADRSTEPSARYWLEDVDLAGKSSWNGPVSLNAKAGKAPTIDQSVLLGKIGMSQAQTTLGQGSVPVERRAGIAGLTPAAMQLQRDVAGQAAMKLSVKQEGWYRASQRDLVSSGFSAKVDPRKLQLYVDGRAVPMIVPGEQDGRFDPSDSVEFFGVGIDSPVTDSHVYWLAAGTQAGSRITSSRGTGQTPGANSFQSSVERKDRTIYFSALKNGEAENFFGPVIGSSSVDQSLTLTNLSTSPLGSASLEVAVQGVTAVAHQVKVTLNGAVLGTISFSGQARHAQTFAVPQSSLREGVNSLQLVSLRGSADISLADSARVTYWHNYRADSNQLRLTAQGGQQVTLSGFTSSAVRVMDVTDAGNPQEVLTTGSGKAGPGALTVNVTGAGQRTLYAFAGDQAKTAALKLNAPSNWRQAGRGADFVIFTRQDLMASLAPLASLRQKDGLSVAVVNIEDVYDEFSFGNKTPQAIKDFLQFAKSNWQPGPRFALLAGDASYDSKNYLGYGDSDLVPTKLIDTRYMEAASDDWFSEFNDGSPQIAMGRLPVRNASEAAALVAKITGYEGSRVVNSVVLASDSFDGFDFAAANNLVRPFIPAGAQVSEVLRGSADDATVKAQLLASINSGARIVTYHGHGAMNQWRGNILTNEDARGLTNGKSLPLFVMMTCLNGYFNDPVLDSLSESLLKAGNGGAVSVWASTAQADPAAQSELNQAFYRELFGPASLTVGEAASRAKSAVTDSDVRRTWILFGDPAMRIK